MCDWTDLYTILLQLFLEKLCAAVFKVNETLVNRAECLAAELDIFPLIPRKRPGVLFKT